MIELAANRYGKSRVRLVKVVREQGRHDLYEWEVEILLTGDFDSAHLLGDNSKLLPTDTMKNTVYFLARRSSTTCIEAFGREVAEFLMERNPQVSAVDVKVESVLWKRLTVDGLPHPNGFMRGSAEREVAKLRLNRGGDLSVASGFVDMILMKTAHSGFAGYIKDDLTTLRETDDRLLCTSVTTEWTYRSDVASNQDSDFRTNRSTVRETMLKAFAAHESLSVQHTLYAMGQAALESTGSIEEVYLLMPNKHCLLIDLQRFGQDNPNEIFVPTDEPHGTIEARLRRVLASPST